MCWKCRVGNRLGSCRFHPKLSLKWGEGTEKGQRKGLCDSRSDSPQSHWELRQKPGRCATAYKYACVSFPPFYPNISVRGVNRSLCLYQTHPRKTQRIIPRAPTVLASASFIILSACRGAHLTSAVAPKAPLMSPSFKSPDSQAGAQEML